MRQDETIRSVSEGNRTELSNLNKAILATLKCTYVTVIKQRTVNVQKDELNRQPAIHRCIRGCRNCVPRGS